MVDYASNYLCVWRTRQFFLLKRTNEFVTTVTIINKYFIYDGVKLYSTEKIIGTLVA